MEPLIEVKNAKFTYDGKKNILEDVSFSLKKGEILCIVGPNGCGKTTLIDSILTFNRLNSGQVLLNGENINKIKASKRAEIMAYIPQGHKPAFGYSVLDIVSMGRTYAMKTFSPPGPEEIDEAREALKQVGMEAFEDRPYTNLSGGELQLVLIARAIAQKSELLIMDEPTAHLDFTHENAVMKIIAELVREKGISIIMATHFLNQAYYLENEGVKTSVALMHGGKFSEYGTPSEVLTVENLQANFNIVTEILEDKNKTRKYILPL